MVLAIRAVGATAEGSAIAPIYPVDELLDVERPAFARVERNDARIGIGAQRAQLLDMGQSRG